MYYENAFVAIFDILGFKNLIKKTSTIELSKFLERFEKEVIAVSNNKFDSEGKIQKSSSSVKCLLFSDTIVLYRSAEKEEDFKIICDRAKLAFVFLASISLSFKNIHFPLRGAIGFGDLFISNFNNLCGSALVDAYKYSEIQTWAGCIATPNFINYAKGKNYKLSDYFIEYDVPLHLKNYLTQNNAWKTVYHYYSKTYYALNWTNKVCANSGFIENLFDNTQDNHVEMIIHNTQEFYKKIKGIQPKIPNILLLGMSGNVTQGILATIKQNNQEANIYGACVLENSIGKYMVDEFFVSPYANKPEFITWLVDICNKYSIDLVLTGVEENIQAISTNLTYLKNNTRSRFIVATPEQLEIGNDKLKTCKWLEEHDCNFPLYADLEDELSVKTLLEKCNYPFIAKPRNGKGSHGIYKIETEANFDKIIDKHNYVLEECLGNPNEEYTVAVYSDKNGVYQNMIIMRRDLQNGTTILAESIQNDKIYNECKKIATELAVAGPLNIQLRMHKGKPTCFELNVRFSGTTPLRNLLGFKDLYACIREYLYEEKPDQYLKPVLGKVIRYTTEKLVEIK